jgi:hypothetical protein
MWGSLISSLRKKRISTTEDEGFLIGEDSLPKECKDA